MNVLDKGYTLSQTFWLSLLADVLGVEDSKSFIEFEDKVKMDAKNGFIDGYIPSTKILIEQKGNHINLRAGIKQSDGSLLTPFQQASRYIQNMPVSKHPRYVITCNFKMFLVYDMEKPNSEPEEILLKNLPKELYRLSFITNSKSEHIKKEEKVSFEAGEIVGKLYDAFAEQYRDLTNLASQRSLNELCVRIVFCLYAEDANLFNRNAFHDYLAKRENLNDMREALIKLFKVLDQKEIDRDPYMEDELKAFPYVNGGLFSNENIEIPTFTEEIRNLLLAKASDDFDWSEISPTIFGAVFESTLNPETRRSGGMHYTSIENIHKVIDPLFLNDLREELNEIEAIKTDKTRRVRLEEYRVKLGKLKFFDPACGSGNFLTETYLSLRRLENEAIENINQGQMILDINNLIKVDIHQFYGIEINDFAVTVAKTALWIAENQMLEKTREIVSRNVGNELPLKTYDNIKESNALRIDWNEVLQNTECSYIMGNPPFVGGKMLNQEQRKDIANIYGKIKLANSLDYVSAWFFKSLEYIGDNKNILCAFVSTNSITQGEQASALWKTLYEKYNVVINFAYRTFRWDSESNSKAHVHCVIIGFSKNDNITKRIYDNEKINYVNNINPYLLDAPMIFVEKKATPLCNVSEIKYGNMPADDGNLIFSNDEYNDIIKKEPTLKKYFRKYIGAKEYINNTFRYCLWIKDIEPSEIRKIPLLYERVQNVRDFRAKSTAAATRDKADKPNEFFFISQPDRDYILIPRVSSEKRRYIPIGFVDKEIISSDANLIITDGNLYSFGVLTSNVHNAWMRVVAGRLEMRYRYSASIVYNTFPWPTPTEVQKKKIEETAQNILDMREKHSNSSLADLYDDLTMPSDLRKAHQENDKAVMEAYGFPTEPNFTESKIVTELMRMYQKLVEENK